MILKINKKLLLENYSIVEEDSIFKEIGSLLEENNIEYILENNQYVIEEGVFESIKNRVKSIGATPKFDPARRKVSIGAGLLTGAGLLNKNTRSTVKKAANFIINPHDGVNNGLVGLGASNHLLGDTKIAKKLKNGAVSDIKSGTSELSKNASNLFHNISNYDGSQNGTQSIDNPSRRKFLKNIGTHTISSSKILSSLPTQNISDKLKSLAKSKISEYLPGKILSKDDKYELQNPQRRKFITNVPKIIKNTKRALNPTNVPIMRGIENIATKIKY